MSRTTQKTNMVLNKQKHVDYSYRNCKFFNVIGLAKREGVYIVHCLVRLVLNNLWYALGCLTMTMGTA